MISGEQLLAAERTRQVEVEGWTAEHDDEHGGRILWEAAKCYEAGGRSTMHVERSLNGRATSASGTAWPWSAEAWKPKSTPENLIRAGALYLAAAECYRRTRDDRPHSRGPFGADESDEDYVDWVLHLADTCERHSRRISALLNEWLSFTAELLDPATTLDDRLARYLAERDHTLSTASLPHLHRIRAQSRYVYGEAVELCGAAEDLVASVGHGPLRALPGLFRAVRFEVADTVLSATTLARDLGATVEDCIAEKTAAERGRG